LRKVEEPEKEIMPKKKIIRKKTVSPVKPAGKKGTVAIGPKMGAKRTSAPDSESSNSPSPTKLNSRLADAFKRKISKAGQSSTSFHSGSSKKGGINMKAGM
jgi:hypothetical protein